MNTWEALGWVGVVVIGAALLVIVAVIWDNWMERRGWRGWKRPE